MYDSRGKPKTLDKQAVLYLCESLVDHHKGQECTLFVNLQSVISKLVDETLARRNMAPRSSLVSRNTIKRIMCTLNIVVNKGQKKTSARVEA